MKFIKLGKTIIQEWIKIKWNRSECLCYLELIEKSWAGNVKEYEEEIKSKIEILKKAEKEVEEKKWIIGEDDDFEDDDEEYEIEYYSEFKYYSYYFGSIKQIAENTGLSAKSVSRALKKLGSGENPFIKRGLKKVVTIRKRRKYEGGYIEFPIPDIHELKKLNSSEIRVYLHILLLNNRPTPRTRISINNISQDIKIGRSSVRRALNKLEEVELIKRRRCDSRWKISSVLTINKVENQTVTGIEYYY